MKLTPITNAMKVAFMKNLNAIPQAFPDDQPLSAAEHIRFVQLVCFKGSVHPVQVAHAIKYVETLPIGLQSMFAPVEKVVVVATVPVSIPAASAPVDAEPEAEPTSGSEEPKEESVTHNDVAVEPAVEDALEETSEESQEEPETTTEASPTEEEEPAKKKKGKK